MISVVKKAIERCINDRSWQIESIKKGIQEDGSGNIVSDQDVKKSILETGQIGSLLIRD